LLVCYPPLSEQRAIATYLDTKCAEIDSLVSLQEEMISELQAYKQSVITEAVTHGLNPNVTMKDSGVEWIGKIPEEWKILRLKNIAKVNGRVGFRGYKTEDLVGEGEGAYTIGGKHISSCKLDLSNADYISWDKYYESPEIMVKKGDIVLAQRGALGKVALIETQIGKATINPSLVLLNNIVGNVKFLYNYLLSDFILTTIALLNTSTAVPMITQKQIENLKVLVPPLPEQQQIAAYLDTKCAEIDSLITIKQQKIDDLKEYKKSIIFEYVTGKKIVPTNIENN
jgi:type I restriction enzyme S subunit